MNCSEAQDLFGQIVDGSVAQKIKRAFASHIASCARCKRSYELEVVAKTLIHSTIARVPAPIDARDAVRASLNREAIRGSRPWPLQFFGRVPASAYAIMAAGALFIYLFLPPPQTGFDETIRHAEEGDVMQQATVTFSLLREGKLKPAMTTCSPENMYAYLRAQGLPFEVFVRPLEHCDGYSAMVSDYDGVKLAHVVYTIGDDMLYVYQVHRDETLTDIGHLTIPLAAKEAIIATGWYTDPEHPDCNVVVWEEAGTLCAATSTMSKSKMMTLLASR